MKVEEIRIGDMEYPEQLRNIYDPPMKLFVLGNKQLLKQKSVSIVGCRDATEYGKKVALKLSKDLSDCGINIISGLAVRYRHICSFGCIIQNNCCFGKRTR